MKKTLGLLISLLMLSGVSFVSWAGTGIEYQYGTISELLAGNYSQKVDVKQVIKDGNSIGVGAGVGLGEVIVLNKKAYLADPEGRVKQLGASDGLSYLTAAAFNADPSLRIQINQPMQLSKLQAVILDKVKNNQQGYAIKISGEFSRLLARSEKFTTAHGVPLVQWMKNNENRYTLTDIRGTLISFYSPPYVKGFGVPGFHSHFISSDHKVAGHVLSGSVKRVVIEVEPLLGFNLRPGNTFNRDKEVSLAGLHKLENAH
ncbi:acetolactate decarboxylase [Dongshaea marina]|uniref:acetolactate decarboxylase n=1 Tax=Dongshaea marina TaxID=2047966 RepID=UPI000D3EB401|nr:acetolactate decarboxylase [Dongshaea marina]